MKKFLLILLFVGFQSIAQFNESFEAAITAPTGWTILNGGDTGTWVGTDLATSATLVAQNGTKCFSISFGATAHNDILATPQFVVTAGVSDKLTFWARSRDAAYPETISIVASTTTATLTSFTTVVNPNIAPASGANFVKYQIDLTSLVGQNIFIGFKSTTTDQFAFDLDNVTVGSTVSCLESLTPPAITSTPTTAVISWTAASPAPANGYDVYYGTTTPTNSSTPNASVAVGVTTLSVSGLTENTKYYVYIRSKCDATTSSVWGHSAAFLTFVNPILLPYATGFDAPAETTGWTVSGNNLTGVGFGSNAPFAQAGAGYFIFPTNPAPAVANNNFLYCRPVTLAANEIVTLSFYYRASTVRNLRVTVGNTNSQAAQTTTVWANNALPASATTYTQIIAPDFVAPSSGTYYFAFNDLSAPAAAANLRIDTVNITSVLSTSEFFSKNFTIYPNPTNDIVNISKNSSIEIKSVTVTDMNGRIVKEIANEVESINIAELSAGVYFLKINTAEGTATTKLVKN